MYLFNKDLIHVAVDSGKSGGKYAFLGQNNEIAADVISTIVKPIEATDQFIGSADRIVVEDNHYLVGGVEGDIVFDINDSKLEDKHELSIFTAVARVLANHLSLDLSNTINIDLSINVPLEDFKNAEIKPEYANRYNVGREVKIILNGVEVNFKIANLRLFYESQGALIRNLHLVNREDSLSQIYVVDLGSKNDTQILFNNKLMPVPGKNNMTGNGINTTLRQLATSLERVTKNQFTIPQVEAILVGKTKVNGLDEAKIDELFAPHARELVQKILNQTDQFMLNKAFVQILFSGGSSIVLKKYLKEAYESAGYTIHFSTDARFDNAKGALIKALEA